MIQWDDYSLPPINLYRMPKLLTSVDIAHMQDLAVPQPSVDATLAERGKRYGTFANHAKIAQDIKRAYLLVPGWYLLADDQKQALEVIADKVARILNGDPNYVDNWHDIQGYAKLVEDRLNNENS